MKSFSEIKHNLEEYGQEHLLKYYDELSPDGRKQLISQIEELDIKELDKLIKDYVLQRPKVDIPQDLQPAKWWSRVPSSDKKDYYAKAVERGNELLSCGEVAFLTVAGGQGTRLGYDAPKGTYPIGPVSGRSLFAYFAGTLLGTQQKYGRKLSWYIMTSTVNRQATEDFFKKNNFFGLDSGQVFFFTQGSMPAVGYDGKLLLGSKDSLALSPNGHGGTLLALRKSGALDKMRQDGIKVISYFQVDNPLAPMTDPLFIGLHDLENSQMSAIMLMKTGPMEKLGNFCIHDNRLHIIEYSDLPQELAERRNADGSLAFAAGSPAIHMIAVDFVDSLTRGGTLRLPWHRADKKIACVAADGNVVKPEANNGVKLESFIFDALPLAERTMILEGERSECFAPTKNAVGVDSVESCRRMLIERDARRLISCGVKIPFESDGRVACKLEIAPELLVDFESLKATVKRLHLTEIVSGSTTEIF